MTRRDCFRTAAGFAAAALSSNAFGAAQCGPATPPFGLQACVAGIPQESLNTFTAVQQASQWCWAACIQMVFGYWGHPVSQQQIVLETWGGIADMPAQPATIVQDLNRPWTDQRGRAFSVSGDVFSANGMTAAQDLAQEMPLIIGSMGHAMVLTAVSYNRVPNGQGQLTGAIVRDPFPGRGRRPLTPMEAAAEMLLVRIRVS